MPSAVGTLLVSTLFLSGCKDSKVQPPVVISTPDVHEGGPVTRVFTQHGWQDGDTVWWADVVRSEAGAPGHVTVIGPGSASCARFFAAKACIEKSGWFDTKVERVVRDLPDWAKSFLYLEICLLGPGR